MAGRGSSRPRLQQAGSVFQCVPCHPFGSHVLAYRSSEHNLLVSANGNLHCRRLCHHFASSVHGEINSCNKCGSRIRIFLRCVSVTMLLRCSPTDVVSSCCCFLIFVALSVVYCSVCGREPIDYHSGIHPVLFAYPQIFLFNFITPPKLLVYKEWCLLGCYAVWLS
jgi:hypothetical protein